MKIPSAELEGTVKEIRAIGKDPAKPFAHVIKLVCLGLLAEIQVMTKGGQPGYDPKIVGEGASISTVCNFEMYNGALKLTLKSALPLKVA